MSTDLTNQPARRPGPPGRGREPESSPDLPSPEPGRGAAEPATPLEDYSIYRQLHADPPPLEECLDAFWSLAVPLGESPGIRPPEAEPFEILKRLGPSPFEGGGFPVIGFLATAYERVSRFAGERVRP
ncbi:MAG TPA: hypothetical protein VM243_13695 [Phycisphaerae bacterium]|nr:hypothetical protein [Phycisphaerae bacterium]